MKELIFREFEKIFLRFLSKNPHYYGDVLVKFFDGKIVSIKAEDSFDVKALNNLKLIMKEDNEMFIKRGASFDKDDKSSKIISEVEMDNNKNIVKESKLEKEEKTEEKKDENNK